MDENVDVDALFEYYIKEGILIPLPWEDGEPTYRLGSDAEKRAPELYKAYMLEVEADVIDLLDQGLVSVDFDDAGTPLYSLTPEGTSYVESILEE
jgi:hypothetical protein